MSLLTAVSRDPGLWLLLLVWLAGEAVGVGRQNQTIAAALAIYASVGVAILFAATGWETTFNWLGATLPTALFVIVVIFLYKRQVTAREEAQQLAAELAAANQQITAYARQVERLTLAEERQRMARELHDTLAQGVAGIIMQLEATNAHLTAGRGERAQAIVQDSMSRARATLREARAVIDDLRAREGTVAFSERLANICQRFQQETGLPCAWQPSADDWRTPTDGWRALDKRLSLDQQEQLERILREALSNAARHAQATAVTVQLHQTAAAVILTVRDNGRGFDPAQPPAPGHYGLRGLRERARLMGGAVAIESAPGQGTTIRATAPTDYQE